MHCGRIKSITTTARTNLLKRKLLTFWLAIASFITTKAKPQAAETVKSAQGASFNCSW